MPSNFICLPFTDGYVNIRVDKILAVYDDEDDPRRCMVAINNRTFRIYHSRSDVLKIIETAITHTH